MVFDRWVSGLLLQVFVSRQLSRHVRKWSQSAVLIFFILFVLQQVVSACWPIHMLVVAVYLEGAGLGDLDLTLRSYRAEERKGNAAGIASTMMVIPTIDWLVRRVQLWVGIAARIRHRDELKSRSVQLTVCSTQICVLWRIRVLIAAASTTSFANLNGQHNQVQESDHNEYDAKCRIDLLTTLCCGYNLDMCLLIFQAIVLLSLCWALNNVLAQCWSVICICSRCCLATRQLM